MSKFWSNLAVQLGKRAGVVSVVGLAMTLILDAFDPLGSIAKLTLDGDQAAEKPGSVASSPRAS